jgi:diguanylate cyclase (GGDEF)-like protein
MLHFARSHKGMQYFLPGVIAAALIGMGTIVFIIHNQDLKTDLINFSLPFYNLFACIALFYAARASRVHSRRMFLAWMVLAFAQFSYTLGDITWSILETGLGLNPFPSIADGFYILYYPVFLAGILVLPMRRLSRLNWTKVALDMSIVMLAAVLAVWNYLLGPLYASEPFSAGFTEIITIAYPVGDLVLLAALLMLLFRQSEEQNHHPLLLLIAGIAIIIISDSLFSYQSLIGTYSSGSLADLGWAIAYLLIGTAGILQGRSMHAKRAETQKRIDPVISSGINRWATYFPYVWVVAGFVILDQSHAAQMPLSPADTVKIVGSIIGLVLVRQMITLNENHLLFQELKDALQRVRQQSLELSSTNQVLESEISERKRAEEQLAYDALHDSLTDLPNRVLFLDRLEHVIEASRHLDGYNFAVLFLDIDHFKSINDSLGHTIGDQLLIQVSQRLSSCIRASDTVARFGGDEFVILLENSGDYDDVIRTANRIQEQIQVRMDLDEKIVFVSVSIGIVMSLNGYIQCEDILRDADLAMYHAKAQGKARYEIFVEELREQAIRKQEIEHDLRHALDSNQLRLDYQPIVSLSTEQIIGFEALLRWNHPTRGLIGPAEFIPIAEETGLIIPIGNWVLGEACRQLREWHLLYPAAADTTMSVNISGVQLSLPNIIENIQEVLLETGLSGRSLRFEMSESICLNKSQLVVDTLKKLSQMGIEFEIDDFGVGYSPLSYLHDYPIHGIKIGRSFINSISGSQPTEIVRTMLTLAKDLGIQTIAEGIETEEQLQGLKALGCGFGQGYIISHPVDCAGIASLLSP